MIAVVLDQGHQKRLRQRLYLRIVKAQSGKTSRRAALGYGAVDDEVIATQVACMGILTKGPLRSTPDQFFEDHFDSVFRRQVHDAIVVRPVILSGSNLNGRPHEPV